MRFEKGQKVVHVDRNGERLNGSGVYEIDDGPKGDRGAYWDIRALQTSYLRKTFVPADRLRPATPEEIEASEHPVDASVVSDRAVLERMLRASKIPFTDNEYKPDDSHYLVVSNEDHGFDLRDVGGSYAGFRCVFKFDDQWKLLMVYAMG